MQGTAMVLMTILGCDDTVTQCHYVETVDRQWVSVQECDAATEDQLARFTGLQYPVIVAACETAAADVAQNDGLPESASGEPETEATAADSAIVETAPAGPVPPADVPGTQAEAETEPGRLAIQKQRVERLMKRVVEILPDTDSIKSLAAKPAHVVTDTYAWVVKKL